jgi:hypothetical protein
MWRRETLYDNDLNPTKPQFSGEHQPRRPSTHNNHCGVHVTLFGRRRTSIAGTISPAPPWSMFRPTRSFKYRDSVD